MCKVPVKGSRGQSERRGFRWNLSRHTSALSLRLWNGRIKAPSPITAIDFMQAKRMPLLSRVHQYLHECRLQQTDAARELSKADSYPSPHRRFMLSVKRDRRSTTHAKQSKQQGFKSLSTLISTGLLGNDLSDIMATLCLIHWLRYLIMFWYSTHLISTSCSERERDHQQ